MPSAEVRIIKNSILGFIIFGLSIVQNILLVPLFLTYWGTEKYGLWVAIFSAFSLLQFFDMGHRTFLGYEVNLLYRSSKSEAIKVMRSGVLFTIFLSSLSLVFLGGLYLFDMSGVIFPEAVLGASSPFISLVVLQISYVCFTSTSGIICSVLFPLDMLYESQLFDLVNRLLTIVLLTIVLLTEVSIESTAVCYSVFQACFAAYSIYFVFTKEPEIFPLHKGISLRTGLKNFYKSLSLTANSFIAQMTNNGANVIVSTYSGVAALPIFTTAKTVGNTGGTLSSILTKSTILEIIRAFQDRESSKVHVYFYANWFTINLVYNGVVLVFSPFIIQLYRVWTKNAIPVDSPLIFLFIAGNALIGAGSILNQFLAATNQLRWQNVINVFRVIVFFSTALLLFRLLGLTAFGVAFVLSEVFSSVILPLYMVNRVLTEHQVQRLPVLAFLSFFSLVVTGSTYLFILSVTGFQLWVYLLFVLLFILLSTFAFSRLPMNMRLRVKQKFLFA